MVQWLRLHASNATGVGLILSPELRSCMPCGVARKKKKNVSGLLIIVLCWRLLECHFVLRLTSYTKKFGQIQVVATWHCQDPAMYLLLPAPELL